MKVLKTVSIFLLLISIFNFTTFAANSLSWFLVKHGNSAPGFPGDADFISKHGGIYIDRQSYDNDNKVIYLTFDAGYENGNITKILDIMKDEGVTGAFFILSNLINKNPDLVRRLTEDGHLVCNHTSDHKDLSRVCTEEMFRDITSLEEKYEACTGLKMEKIFRFPEGKYSREAIEALDNAGYKTVFWSMAYDDWDNSRQPNKEAAIKKLLGTTHNGAIVLLHPTSSTNAEILPYLIKEWRAQGYSFGSLKDLCV